MEIQLAPAWDLTLPTGASTVPGALPTFSAEGGTQKYLTLHPRAWDGLHLLRQAIRVVANVQHLEAILEAQHAK